MESELVKELVTVGKYFGLMVAVVVPSAFAVTLISEPVGAFFSRRGIATKLAGYVDVPPTQINLYNANWVHGRVFPRGGNVLVPVSISDKNPLRTALMAYYRHPAGVGSEEALCDFLANPEVVSYLTQPVSRLERILQVF